MSYPAQFKSVYFGALQFFTSEVDPTELPPCPEKPAQCYQITSSRLWIWNVITQTWEEEPKYQHYGESFSITPALPYSFTSNVRSVLEVVYTLNPNGAADAKLLVQRSGGTPNISLEATGALNDPIRHSSFHLSPGDTLTLSDTSDPTASAVVNLVIVFEE